MEEALAARPGAPAAAASDTPSMEAADASWPAAPPAENPATRLIYEEVASAAAAASISAAINAIEQGTTKQASSSEGGLVGLVRAVTNVIGAADSFMANAWAMARQKLPARSGSWFVVHRSMVEQGKVRYDETCDIWKEFLSLHPNRDEFAKEFLGIRLSQAQLEEQRALVKPASYRWMGVKGMAGSDGASLPNNYVWFLKLIEQRELIGWMDCFAGTVCNVPTSEVLRYMGGLYASHGTIADWMYDPSLLRTAITRAWIFQETAFGLCDEVSVQNYLDTLMELGEQAQAGDIDVLCTKLYPACEHFGDLLTRRGLNINFKGLIKDTPTNRAYESFATAIGNRVDGDAGVKARAGAELLAAIRRIFGRGGKDRWMVLDASMRKDDLRDKVFQAVKANLTMTTTGGISSPEAFFNKFAVPCIQNFVELDLTVETDRPEAISAVARSILQTKFGKTMTPAEFMRSSWVAMDREWRGKTGGWGCTAYVNPTCRFEAFGAGIPNCIPNCIPHLDSTCIRTLHCFPHCIPHCIASHIWSRQNIGEQSP